MGGEAMRRKLMAMHSQIVAFEDPLVKSICVEKFGGVDGITDRQYGTAGVKGYDGECTYRQLDAVKNIGRAFYGKGIVKFNEFRHFTSCTKIGNLGFPRDSEVNSFTNSTLEEITLPPTFKNIGWKAFQGTRLKRLVIPEGYAYDLYESQFANCYYLRYMEYPSTLYQRIGWYAAFRNVSNLVIVIKAKKPPLQINISTKREDITFYVPDESVDLYKAHAGLALYKDDRIKPLSEYQP